MRDEISRRQFVKSTALAAGALAAPTIWRVDAAFADTLPDPDEVLKTINLGNYVNKQYLEQFGLGPDDLLWDPKLDWIRTADWEAIRSKFAGQTVRFAMGAADASSVSTYIDPFRKLSGMQVEVVAIPDAQLFDKAITNFQTKAGRFDAIEYFSPYLGDFAAPGYLYDISEFVEKWKFPMHDFVDTYRLNYAQWGDHLYGIPYDCDFQQFQVRGKQFKQILGSDVHEHGTIKTYDDLLRVAKELNKPKLGFSGIGLMTQRGFWATYSWQHVGAQHGLRLFDENWEPQFDSEAGIKAAEIILEMQKSAPAGVTGWGWPENRGAWLGGQVAMNMAWQDQGNQCYRKDQSTIWDDDVVTIYEPLASEGAPHFAPPNVAGSTSSVAASAKNPEAGFLMLAFYTTASLQAMNGANANGVGAGYGSVINNKNFQKIMVPADVWAAEVPYAWCAPRIPGGLPIDIALGNQLNAAFTGNKSIKDALKEGNRMAKEIMKRNGFYSDKPPLAYDSIKDRIWLGKDKKLPF
jgi:multiple sugar transport system substrate-binding protein